MANIVFINVLSRMNHAVGHLMGALREAGHQTHTIRFKRQDHVFLDDHEGAKSHDFGHVSHKHYVVRDRDLVKQEYAAWKKVLPREKAFLIERLKELNPDAIGITSLSHSMNLAREVIDFLREHFNVPFLMGGSGSITEPELAISFSDLVCTGEGEQVIVDIADRLDLKRDLSGIAGTLYRLPDGEIQRNGKAPLTDLSTLVMPVYDPGFYTYINGYYFEKNVSHNHRTDDHSFTIMTQRGCPFSCSFCIESFLQNEFGKKEHLRRVSPDRAIAELKYAKDVLGFTEITFWDDVFPINPEWLNEFLPKYKTEIGLPFFCYTYPSTTKPDILAKLKDAGCTFIGMGIQSGSERILVEAFDRKVKQSIVLQSVNYLVESGIERITVDLIPKTPYDREEDLYKTLLLMLEIPRALLPSGLNELILFPNYLIHERVREKNLIGSSEPLTEDIYLFYLKLMVMTRLEYDRTFILECYQDPDIRTDHNKLNRYLMSMEEIRENKMHTRKFPVIDKQVSVLGDH